MKNIHNQNVAELVHHAGVGTCFEDTGIFVWHLFSLGLLKTLLLHLIQNQVGNRCTLIIRFA